MSSPPPPTQSDKRWNWFQHILLNAQRDRAFPNRLSFWVTEANKVNNLILAMVFRFSIYLILKLCHPPRLILSGGCLDKTQWLPNAFVSDNGNTFRHAPFTLHLQSRLPYHRETKHYRQDTRSRFYYGETKIRSRSKFHNCTGGGGVNFVSFLAKNIFVWKRGDCMQETWAHSPLLWGIQYVQISPKISRLVVSLGKLSYQTRDHLSFFFIPSISRQNIM